MTAIALQHRDKVIAELSQGRFLKQIAKDLGVTKQALSRPLKNDPDYQQALEEQADALVEDALTEQWEAREAVDIARAREKARSAFRYAESINARKWAPRQNITVNQTVTVEVAMSDELQAALGEIRGHTLPAQQVIDDAEFHTVNQTLALDGATDNESDA